MIELVQERHPRTEATSGRRSATPRRHDRCFAWTFVPRRNLTHKGRDRKLPAGSLTDAPRQAGSAVGRWSWWWPSLSAAWRARCCTATTTGARGLGRDNCVIRELVRQRHEPARHRATRSLVRARLPDGDLEGELGAELDGPTTSDPGARTGGSGARRTFGTRRVPRRRSLESRCSRRHRSARCRRIGYPARPARGRRTDRYVERPAERCDPSARGPDGKRGRRGSRHQAEGSLSDLLTGRSESTVFQELRGRCGGGSDRLLHLLG